MFLVDEDKLIIHSMASPKYECKIKDIPEDKRRKVYTIDQVKRMVDPQHRPQYNGCQWCMAEYHTFDMQAIFKRD